MSQGAPPVDAPGRASAAARLGGLDRSVLAAIAAMAGDIVLLIDGAGFIRDMSVGSSELAADGVAAWLDGSWIETATGDTRHKVEDLLHDARAGAPLRWREINQVSPRRNALMMRYAVLPAGRDGEVVAVGRDDRAIAGLQQRLLETQQTMERDYARLRDAESRFRLLWQISGEAMMIVDAATRRVLEVNPAAEALLEGDADKINGESFTRMFDDESQDDAASLLATAVTAARATPTTARLVLSGRELDAAASPYRRGRATQCLVRLAPTRPSQPAGLEESAHVHAVIERMPDALVVTDDSLRIMTVNSAFLDLLRYSNKEQVVGQSMSEFLGRAPAERNILVGNVREHGYVRNYATVVRDRYEEYQDVEVSVVSAPEEKSGWYGFHIRSVRRPEVGERSTLVAPDLHRSVEKLTELVGRVKLKDLVRETTDIVERLCIEAALELTKNNRASAAELLGLSRQSLYSKLNRFGAARVYTDED